jgi:nucleotide-binding universal stress UspA family protein
MIRHIIVAVDINENTRELVQYAAVIAEKFKAKTWILHISAPDPEFIGYDVGPQYIRDGRADELREQHKLLQGYAKILEDKGLECEALLIQGHTVEAILQKATKIKADLIVIGSHEHSFLYDAFVGNTCIELFKKSMIPLLILPLQ